MTTDGSGRSCDFIKYGNINGKLSINFVKAGEMTLYNQIVNISPQMKGLGLLGQTFFGSYDVTIKKDVIELRYR